MASLVLSGDTSGSITVSAPTVAGSNTQTLAATTGTLAPIIGGNSVTASGTEIGFTSIPSWVKKITLCFNGISSGGSAGFLVQLGDSGGYETSGYSGTVVYATSATPTAASFSSAFTLAASSTSSATTLFGSMIISLCDTATNTWVEQSCVGGGNNNFVHVGGGAKSLSATLDRVRVTAAGDTFDAGTINILYE